ncbi:tetratricopeptide repeat protein [Novipirellula sp. SH528]|uniref:tetratricopeptide repeat protein n=1 Tax=Novipirellula sp. SH528 TaxID=3454466 RepID=UPI003FA0FC0C
MCRPFTLEILLGFVGCANDASTPPSAAETTTGISSTGDLDAGRSLPEVSPELVYPEKSEVLRLLVRATTLESDGRFEDALSVANQAVAIDPNSPKASELKARLEELLRRV